MFVLLKPRYTKRLTHQLTQLDLILCGQATSIIISSNLSEEHNICHQQADVLENINKAGKYGKPTRRFDLLTTSAFTIPSSKKKEVTIQST